MYGKPRLKKTLRLKIVKNVKMSKKAKKKRFIVKSGVSVNSQQSLPSYPTQNG